jgi:hypothetical protein
MAEPLQKKRLLRMTVAHYRQSNVSEENFYQWVTEQHAARAAKLHAKNGIEGFSIVSTRSSRRLRVNLKVTVVPLVLYPQVVS